METYAQIIRGKVHWIGKPKVLPEDKGGGLFIDLTDVEPKPKCGWLYSAGDKTFREPILKTSIDVKTLSQHEVNEMILRKLGYNVKFIKEV